MPLEYLLFDASDEDDGACSFDALASVRPAHQPGLAREIAAVLGWAHRSFGPPRPLEDGGEWDFALHATGEDDASLAIAYDPASGQLHMPKSAGRVSVSLTLSGAASFAAAFREAFADAD
jgi:hypothetical protein